MVSSGHEMHNHGDNGNTHSHDHNALTGHHAMVSGESSPVEYLKLAAVLLAVTLVAAAHQRVFGDPGWLKYLQSFMGVFFVVFAAFKFVGYKMFAMMFAGYDILANRFSFYAYAYPFIELGLGALYLADALPVWRDVITAVIMGISVIGVVQEIKKRSGIHCACLGNVIKLPLSTVSFIEDAGMGIMALVMLYYR